VKRQVKKELRLRRGLKLRLLALVLALALTWYALNPAPGPVRRRNSRPGDAPEGKRREERSRVGGRVHADAGLGRAANRPATERPREPEDVEALDWPEYIEVD